VSLFRYSSMSSRLLLCRSSAGWRACNCTSCSTSCRTGLGGLSASSRPGCCTCACTKVPFLLFVRTFPPPLGPRGRPRGRAAPGREFLLFGEEVYYSARDSHHLLYLLGETDIPVGYGRFLPKMTGYPRGTVQLPGWFTGETVAPYYWKPLIQAQLSTESSVCQGFWGFP
jgi:hypothetical protein